MVSRVYVTLKCITRHGARYAAVAELFGFHECDSVRLTFSFTS